jgi:peptidoglycan/xylan/chitin deacetylase (PgdA/CDA1 family)
MSAIFRVIKSASNPWFHQSWYRAGGMPKSSVVAAYNFIGAPTEALAYKDLVGAHHLQLGVAPTWNKSTGLAFDGSTQYLNTGVVPVTGWSVYIELADINPIGTNDTPLGSVGPGAGNTMFHVKVGTTPRHKWGNGGSLTVNAANPSAGSYCMAGLLGYIDGTLDGTILTGWDAAVGDSIYLGVQNTNGAPTASTWYRGKIKRLAIYNIELTNLQQLSLYYHDAWSWSSLLPMNLGTAPNKIPATLFTFDDEWANVHTNALPKMVSRNVPGTMYVVTDHVGTGDYMSVAQLLALQSAGWTVANHTTDHTDLNTLSLAEQTAHIADARTQLLAWGLTGGDHLAAPHGAINADTLTACTNLGIKTLRYSETAPYNIDIEAMDLYALNARNLYATLAYADAKALITTAITNKEVTLFYAHEIVDAVPVANQWAKTDFENLIDNTVARGVAILNVEQLYNLRQGNAQVQKPTVY